MDSQAIFLFLELSPVPSLRKALRPGIVRVLG